MSNKHLAVCHLMYTYKMATSWSKMDIFHIDMPTLCLFLSFSTLRRRLLRSRCHVELSSSSTWRPCSHLSLITSPQEQQMGGRFAESGALVAVPTDVFSHFPVIGMYFLKLYASILHWNHAEQVINTIICVYRFRDGPKRKALKACLDSFGVVDLDRPLPF